jgi:hypothetical protein
VSKLAAPSSLLRARLEQRIFEGKLKESKTKGKEVNWTVWNTGKYQFLSSVLL